MIIAGRDVFAILSPVMLNMNSRESFWAYLMFDPSRILGGKLQQRVDIRKTK